MGHDELKSSAPPKKKEATVGLGIVTGGWTVTGSNECVVADSHSPSSQHLHLSLKDLPLLIKREGFLRLLGSLVGDALGCAMFD